MKITGIQVVIVCKAPVAGRVKTRLMAAFSAQKAADLHAAMAMTVIHRAMRLFEDVVVAADDPSHPFFTRFDLPVTAQGEGDLGDRMLSQVVRAFEDGASRVMLLGTDSPHMPDAKLLEASALLQNHSVVIGPVEDGGYELIGLSSPHRSEEHTSELQSRETISYAVFCLKKKNTERVHYYQHEEVNDEMTGRPDK